MSTPRAVLRQLLRPAGDERRQLIVVFDRLGRRRVLDLHMRLLMIAVLAIVVLVITLLVIVVLVIVILLIVTLMFLGLAIVSLMLLFRLLALAIAHLGI